MAFGLREELPGDGHENTHQYYPSLKCVTAVMTMDIDLLSEKPGLRHAWATPCCSTLVVYPANSMQAKMGPTIDPRQLFLRPCFWGRNLHALFYFWNWLRAWHYADVLTFAHVAVSDSGEWSHSSEPPGDKRVQVLNMKWLSMVSMCWKPKMKDFPVWVLHCAKTILHKINQDKSVITTYCNTYIIRLSQLLIFQIVVAASLTSGSFFFEFLFLECTVLMYSDMFWLLLDTFV